MIKGLSGEELLTFDLVAAHGIPHRLVSAAGALSCDEIPGIHAIATTAPGVMGGWRGTAEMKGSRIASRGVGSVAGTISPPIGFPFG
jgi:hypothetical protein